jgi:myo-inositol-1(or 4)-monophosphatase
MIEEERRWLDCTALMAAAGKEAAQRLYGTASGRVALGRGAGGDRTLEIDRACETAMLEVLRQAAPFPYSLVSEEAGVCGSEDAPWRLVVDPLDGSLNAKRGLEPFAASIAVANGPTLADVRVAYVEDYTRPRVFSAVKGAGLLSPLAGPGGGPLGRGATILSQGADGLGQAVGGVGRPGDTGRQSSFEDCRYENDLVEIVLLEAGRPDRHHFSFHDLSVMGAVGCSRDMRIRQIGSLALSLCYVATGKADMLLAAVRARSVDLAAGLLMVAEAGGGAANLTGENIWHQPLDLEKRSPFVAWRAGLNEEEVFSRSRRLRRSLLGYPE